MARGAGEQLQQENGAWLKRHVSGASAAAAGSNCVLMCLANLCACPLFTCHPCHPPLLSAGAAARLRQPAAAPLPAQGALVPGRRAVLRRGARRARCARRAPRGRPGAAGGARQQRWQPGSAGCRPFRESNRCKHRNMGSSKIPSLGLGSSACGSLPGTTGHSARRSRWARRGGRARSSSSTSAGLPSPAAARGGVPRQWGFWVGGGGVRGRARRRRQHSMHSSSRSDSGSSSRGRRASGGASARLGGRTWGSSSSHRRC